MSGVRRVLALVALSSCPAIAVGACESHVPEYALVDSGEAGEAAPHDTMPLEDTASDLDAASDEAAPPLPPQAHLRFALWSPDIPASDFCVAPHVTASDASADGQSVDSGPAWIGPLIGQAASAVDGGVTTIFDGDSRKQYEAIWNYLLAGPAIKPPGG